MLTVKHGPDRTSFWSLVNADASMPMSCIMHRCSIGSIGRPSNFDIPTFYLDVKQHIGRGRIQMKSAGLKSNPAAKVASHPLFLLITVGKPWEITSDNHKS